MKLGILNSRPIQQGAVQLSAAILEALTAGHEWEVTVIHQDAATPNYPAAGVQTVRLGEAEPPWVRWLRAACTLAGRPCRLGRYRKFQDWQLDLLVATPAASLVGIYSGLPYIGTIADMMYRFYPDLPEYPRRERIKRQYLYGKCVRNSVLTVVDSECARDHAVRFLGVDRARTAAAPYIPPPYVFRGRQQDESWVFRQTERFQLPDRFLLYPAQFWEHKNHRRLLQAVRWAEQKTGGAIHLALAGSKRGAFEDVLAEIGRQGLQDRVHLLGYVSDDELVALYRRCVALVFPSLFGPTNIPLTEAIVLGVPQACSNLFAMPEQVGPAALLFDPFSVEDIGRCVARLWTDEPLRQELRRQAALRAPEFSQERFARDWQAAVRTAAATLRLPVMKG